MWKLLTRPVVLLGEKLGIGAAARVEGAVAKEAAHAATTVASKEAGQVASETAKAAAKPGMWARTKSFFGFGAGGAAAEGGMSVVGKFTKDFAEKTMWGKLKDVAIIGAIAYGAYKLFGMVFGSKEEEMAPQAQMMAAPAMAPMVSPVGMAPQMQWGQAVAPMGGMAYAAGVGDSPYMFAQSQSATVPATNSMVARYRPNGKQAVQGNYAQYVNDRAAMGQLAQVGA